MSPQLPSCVHCALCQSQHHRQNHIRNYIFANLSSIVKTTAGLCQRILHFKVYLDVCNSCSCKTYRVLIRLHITTYNHIRRVVGMMLILTHYCARRHCVSIPFLFAGFCPSTFSIYNSTPHIVPYKHPAVFDWVIMLACWLHCTYCTLQPHILSLME